MAPRLFPRFVPALLGVCLAGTASAQTYTAYPIDDLHGVFGHWAPFGILSTGNADETRSQYLIPAHFLSGAGALISGIEVSPHVTGNVPYERLIIRFGLTNVTTLSPVFASNAPALVPVYSRTNFSMNWTSSTQWQLLTLTQPFPWDGRSSLLIEVEKVLDRPNNPTLPTISHQFSNLPMRRDLPLPIFREGAYNSGAATAATGSAYSGGPLLMRVRWFGDPSLTITSSRTGGGSYYRLGQTITLTTQARSGDLFGVFLDVAVNPAPVFLPGVGGGYWLPRMLLMASGSVGSTGSASLNIPIPSDPGLIGGQIYFQNGVAGPSRLALTNVVDAIIAQ